MEFLFTPIPPPAARRLPKIHAAALSGVGDMAPSTLRIPNANYTDPAILAAELRTSFNAPLLVTPSRAITEPGDYLTLQLVDTPVLVVRGDDGRARVLLNACRHRGAAVAEGSGCERRFTCPYHNWVYDTEGALVGIPGREGFDDIELADHGLLELPSEERHGFVWALRDPNGALDLDAHLGPLDAELAEWGYNYYIAGTLDLAVKSNWKCSMEAFLETYHFPYVHANSIVNGSISNVVTFDQIGRHHCLGVPAKALAALPEPTMELTSNIYYIYPNTVIAKSLLGGEMLQFSPGPTPTSSTIRHTILSRKEVTGEVAAWYEGYIPKIQGAIRDEDAPVLERSGQGLAAGRTDVILGRNEIGCQAAHRQILADLADEATDHVAVQPVLVRPGGDGNHRSPAPGDQPRTASITRERAASA